MFHQGFSLAKSSLLLMMMMMMILPFIVTAVKSPESILNCLLI